MADTAKAFGKAGSIAWKGKEYRLSPLTLDDIAEFEVWLEAQAWNAPERTRHMVTPDVYERRLSAIARQVASKEFAWGSAAATRASESLDGKKFTLFLQLRHNHPDITYDEVDQMVTEELAQVLVKVEEANAIRNPSEPAPADNPGASSS